MNAGKFTLGDSVVVMGYDYELRKREPIVEGIVTACGANCVRIRFRSRIFGFLRERWFAGSHSEYHVERVKELV